MSAGQTPNQQDCWWPDPQFEDPLGGAPGAERWNPPVQQQSWESFGPRANLGHCVSGKRHDLPYHGHDHYAPQPPGRQTTPEQKQREGRTDHKAHLSVQGSKG